MISLRMLGGLVLATERGQVTGRAAQKRRLAVLALLARAPGRRLSREKLIGYLWPEYDSRRARRLLSLALHEIRREIGAAALEGVGDDVVLSPDVLCDVEELRTAAESGDAPAAGALYGGPFLDGFYVDDAPDFERWVEEERQRLLQMLTAALEAAAVEARARGAVRDAAEAWVIRCAVDPRDRRSAIECARALAEAGEPDRAIGVLETFAARFTRDHEMEPPAEVLAEIGRLRDSAYIGVTDLAPADVAPALDQTTSISTASTSTVPRPRPARRLHVTALVLGTIALSFALFAALRLQGSAGPPATVERLAILPFPARGAADLSHLADLAGAATDLLGLRLEAAGVLEVLDGSGPAGDPGASLVASGELIPASDGVDLIVTVRNRDGTTRVRAERRIAGAGETGEMLPDQLDDLARALLIGIALDPRDAPDPMDRPSFPALRAYIAGDRAFSDGEYNRAVAELQRAVELDSGFVSARYRLAVAAEWAGRMDVFIPALKDAWSRRDRVHQRTRLLVEGLYAIHVLGEDVGAEQAYRTLLAHDPDDLDALTNLVDLYFHHGVWGPDNEEIRRGFERVFAADPTDANVLLHLARLAAARGDRPALRSLVADGLELGGDGLRGTELRALLAFTALDSLGMRRSLEEMGRLDDDRVQRLGLRTILYTPPSADQSRIAALLTHPSRPAELRAFGHALIGGLAATEGRADSTMRSFGRARDAHPAIGTIGRAIILSHPAVEATRAMLVEAARALDSLPAAATTPDHPLPVDVRDATVATLLRGLLWLRAGNRGEADAALETLVAQAGPRAEAAADLLGAFLLMDGGNPQAALARIGRETRSSGYEPAGLEPYLRSRILLALGDSVGAERWAGAQLQEHPFSFLARAAGGRVNALDGGVTAP